MKILFLSENFPPESNAAATRVYERACYWAAWGHDVTIITSNPNFPEGRLFPGYENRWRQEEHMDGLRIVRVKTYISANRGVLRRTLDFLSFMLTGAWAGLRVPRPDVVSATSPQFFAAVAGWFIGAVRRVPFVFELGDLWPESIAAVGAMKKSFALAQVEKLELFLYRQSSAVAALTRSFKKNLVGRGIHPDKIAVVMNGVDLSRYAPRPRDKELASTLNLQDRFVVGYVGTHGMAHALSNVLDTAALLREESDISFLLAGAGAEREGLMKEATRRDLRNVIFLERQPKDRMPAVWSLCSVALVHLKDSSVFAGVIPSKIFEAQAMGLPVLLAAPTGEASTIIEEDECGLHVPAENPNDLAAAILGMRGDKKLLETFASKSLKAASTHSREAQARQMLRVLELASMGKGLEAGEENPS